MMTLSSMLMTKALICGIAFIKIPIPSSPSSSAAKIGQCHSKALTTEVSAYLMMAVAKMFRLLYSAEPHNASSMFSIEPHRWHGYSDAVMRMAEANVEALLDGQDVNGGEGVKDPACLAMTTESLTREFPLYTPSLLNLVKTSETHVKGLSPQE